MNNGIRVLKLEESPSRPPSVARVMVVRKHSPTSVCFPSLAKRKQVSWCSEEEVIRLYQGFEGHVSISFLVGDEIGDDGEVVTGSLEAKRPFCAVLCVTEEIALPKILDGHVAFMGYEVGFCGEQVIHSAIFHEILFGTVRKLISYKKFLNRGFLFPNRQLAEEFLQTLSDPLPKGKKLQDSRKMGIYAVWK
jgi:hypothetical protein